MDTTGGAVDAAAYHRTLGRRESIHQQSFDPDLLTAWPREFLESHAVAPLRRTEGRVTVFGAESGYGAALEIGMLLGCEVDFVAGEGKEVRRFIAEKYDQGSSKQEAIAELDEPSSVKELEELANDAPVVRLVNHVLQQAVERRASDVHIEAYEDETLIRLRIDGVLLEYDRLPRGLHPGLVSRIKILARLDIAQTRLPQDGRIAISVAGREIDLRVSTIPTPLGERAVLRILDRSSVRFGLMELGMVQHDLDKWKEVIASPHGIILVTGPTGSGKTTTLYAAMGTLNTGRVNILTVEDPVEYLLKGVGQIQVNPRINLTFASGLRSILRQDPDVIMVGEIRDGETAKIAVQASLTGHLVLSTLHTNDAASASPRLMDMGVEPYLIGSTLRAVLAQRLVRVLCPACRQPAPIDHADAAALDIPADATVYRAVGCAQCDGLGFKGRTGIFELLPVEGEVRELIINGQSALHIGRAAREAGMRSMRDDSREKVLAGITTADEVMRATEAS